MLHPSEGGVTDAAFESPNFQLEAQEAQRAAIECSAAILSEAEFAAWLDAHNAPPNDEEIEAMAENARKAIASHGVEMCAGSRPYLAYAINQNGRKLKAGKFKDEAVAWKAARALASQLAA